jgi:ATP-dependent DNA helicase RecQ
MTSLELPDDVVRAACEKFGWACLRPGQEEAVAAVLAARDTLVVMPTGSGKSGIYQIAGDILPGATVVVSPLLALQRDQVESIEEADVGDAAALNSTLRVAEREEVLEAYVEGETEFLFLAPEQFANDETMLQVQAARPSLFVVDEAHCISEWGHDFRPEYLRLGTVIEQFERPRILALTATASPLVQQEIAERLGMRDPEIIVRGFDRPNIHLEVESFAEEADKEAELVKRVVAAPKPGIVYAATRKHTEALATALTEQGVDAVAYHAGMPAAERSRIQDAFMADEVDVMVATNAFGMGVDKPNVRFVYHLDVSDSVDAYYQEIGRAGRDGEPAEACLFFRSEDLNLHRFFAGTGRVNAEQLEQIAEVVQEADGPVPVEEVSDESDLSQTKVTVAINRLEEVGAVDVLPSGEVVATTDDVTESAAEAVAAQERREKYVKSRLEMMRGYADMTDCRRAYLLNYFGETYTPPCSNCDNCEAGLVIAGSGESRPFPLHSRVEHTAFGTGMVMRYSWETMVVLFESVGYRTLAIDLVLEQGLLTAAA